MTLLKHAFGKKYTVFRYFFRRLNSYQLCYNRPARILIAGHDAWLWFWFVKSWPIKALP